MPQWPRLSPVPLRQSTGVRFIIKCKKSRRQRPLSDWPSSISSFRHLEALKSKSSQQQPSEAENIFQRQVIHSETTITCRYVSIETESLGLGSGEAKWGADWLSSPLGPPFHFEAGPAAYWHRTKKNFQKEKSSLTENKMVRRSAEEEAERQPKKAD